MASKKNFVFLHHPDMIDYDSRVASFTSHWPSNRAQKLGDLARAGFFYVGEGDKTICFFCGGAVCCWDINDDPWQEHARWYPECGFVKSQQGSEFVKLHRQTPVQPSRTAITADLETLRNERACKMCLDADCSISFHPCGHFVSCKDCAARLCLCPICRTVIVRKELIFLA